jgi:peptidoglycan biosynthesis protein MviN/MurJ (putative lipid II flippase)
MFLRAGVLSLALLLASRIAGLLRESAMAAAFGASGRGDIAILMLTLPDWLAGVLASGALAYVLLPAWAHEDAGRVAATQRRVGRMLLAVGVGLAVLLALLHGPAVAALAGGLPQALHPEAGRALLWSALALPLALLASLGMTRLQHERDFVGMYASNVVVNVVLIAALGLAAWAVHLATVIVGIGLLLAMLARLAWQHHRQRPFRRLPGLADSAALPAWPVWAWAAAAAGLPLALPFVARSLASQQGAGALATFNYAWKLVELPLLLAVQLVGTLALGPIVQALRSADAQGAAAAEPLRRGFALAWTLACAAVAGLLFAAPAVTQLLFGWGRMDAQALAHVAQWGRIGSWSLLPQALVTIALAVLAAQERMRVAVLAYAAALVLLLLAHPADGVTLMLWLDGLWAALALVVMLALGPQWRRWLPWPALIAAGGTLLLLQAVLMFAGLPHAPPLQWLAAIAAALGTIAIAWCASADLRAALRR